MAKIRWKRQPVIRFLQALGAVGTFAFILMAFTPNSEPCNCDRTKSQNGPDLGQVLGHNIDPGDPNQGGNSNNVNIRNNENIEHDNTLFRSRHKLAVIVPFRDRYTEMLTFVPHIHKYLNAKNIDHRIYVINQLDELRFNRASLINIGYLLSHSECDYLAMHDVDLLPLNPELNYTYPKDGPFHVAAPYLHPKYHYSAFIGGILLINNNHFKLVNGLSNKYYGWGMEDDEFYVRILEMNLAVSRPTHIKTGFKTFEHVHDKKERPRDYKQYGQQRKMSRQRDRASGADNVDFEFKYITNMHIEGAPLTFVGVELNCDLALTPWCVHPTDLQRIMAKGYPSEGNNNNNKVATAEEKRLDDVKSHVIKYQEEVSEFRKHVKPVRTVSADELPKWMKDSVK